MLTRGVTVALDGYVTKLVKVPVTKWSTQYVTHDVTSSVDVVYQTKFVTRWHTIYITQHPTLWLKKLIPFTRIVHTTHTIHKKYYANPGNTRGFSAQNVRAGGRLARSV